MANAQNHLSGVDLLDATQARLKLHPDRSDVGKFGMSNRLKGAGDEAGANGARRIAAANSNQLAAPCGWNCRRRDQIARKIQDVAHVISAPYPAERLRNDALTVCKRQLDRLVDTQMMIHEVFNAGEPHARFKVRFNEGELKPILAIGAPALISDKKRGVGPRRMREIFHRRSNHARAFNEQHVARHERDLQKFLIGRE